ncbi:MAG: SufS family cysteine desulfurase [Dermatophilaceae bacterium]
MTPPERTWADVDPLWPPTAPLTPAISPQALAGLAAQAFGMPVAPVGPSLPDVGGALGGLHPAAPVAPRGGAATPGVGAAQAAWRVHEGFDPAHVPDLRPAYDTSVFDVTTLRRDFPILSEQVHGRPLIWLDNAATTQKPRAVIDRLTWFYEHENSNIHRAAHELAARATEAYEDARATVRRFVNAPREQEITFVRGTTEGINLVAHAWGMRNLREGDEILITHLEHHANIVPWQMVARRTGATLQVAPVDDEGNLLMDRFAELLGPRTRMVAVTAVSNALGTVTPLEQIVDLAHRAGARVLVDGAQSVPHLPVDLQRVPADFFTFSGHKIFGPTGIGALYVSERVWDETPAWQGGGNMIQDVTLERSTYRSPPDLWEAGTGNIADAVGLGEALKYVERVGIERIAAWEHRLLEHATPRLAAVPGVRLVGTARQKASVLSFVMAGRDPVDVGKQLDAEGIAVRAGHHCAQPILRRLGLQATVRPAFAFYNTLEEADALVAAVRRISESSVQPA